MSEITIRTSYCRRCKQAVKMIFGTSVKGRRWFECTVCGYGYEETL